MNKKDVTSVGLRIIIVIVLLFAVLFVGSRITHRLNTNAYNNGVCTTCGGRYVYQQAVGHQYSTDYIYICNQCGRMLTIDYYAGP